MAFKDARLGRRCSEFLRQLGEHMGGSIPFAKRGVSLFVHSECWGRRHPQRPFCRGIFMLSSLAVTLDAATTKDHTISAEMRDVETVGRHLIEVRADTDEVTKVHLDIRF
ncbi:hypothetical protein BTE77_35120 [Ensifer adhaerens]|nr:hypothetical protein BTE77_35120 [Ensifer adhaerens]